MNPKATPYWTSTEASVWREFLNTDTGKKLLRFLAEEAPSLLRKGDVNEILIRSGEVANHHDVLAALIDLTGTNEVQHVEETVSGSEYPPLEDDSQWPGDKINS